MTIKVMINGFGRIGRLTLRALVETNRKDIEIVAINNPKGPKAAAHLYKYDSVHGIASKDVKYGDDWIDVGLGKIHVFSSYDVSSFDLSNIDLVMECSGKFKKAKDFDVFFDCGAKKVLVSAPVADASVGKTVVYGVNHNDITPDDKIISNASCTTNCLAPIVKVIEDNLGIESGFMTTIHAYTGDQNLVDSSHKDMRRARAGAMSIIPTSTGAAKSISLVIPSMNKKLDGVAMRVPTANVSCVDLKVELKKSTTVDEVNSLMKKASENELKNVLGYETDELVSIDFNHNPNSSIFDATQTMMVTENSLRVCSWYDNEWGFSCRMLDTAAVMFK